MSRALGFWLALLLIFSGSMIVWMVARNQSANSVGTLQEVDPDAPPAATAATMDEFELMDQLGKRVSSKEWEGDVWAGSFFFAACPSICYQQNIKLQQLHQKYKERGLKLVSITCDPKNDTPVALATYAGRFSADPRSWKFLTTPDGDLDYIRQIGNEYFKVAVGEETHTDRVLLFNRAGEMVGGYSVMKLEQFNDLDQQIDRLLSEPTSEDNSSAGGDDSAEAPASEQAAPDDSDGETKSEEAAANEPAPATE